MKRPRALDLFCGQGGAGWGLHLAGFDVVGVDSVMQQHYPLPFVQGDALNPPVRLDDFDFIWASPPCKAYTVAQSLWGRVHPELIEPTRSLLRDYKGLYSIENVPGAPLRTSFRLCGAAFGLKAIGDDGVHRQLRRHRIFECNFMPLAPSCRCEPAIEKISIYGNGGGWSNRENPDRVEYKGSAREWREALQMPWGTVRGMSQAIPPAYSRWIGEQAIKWMEHD